MKATIVKTVLVAFCVIAVPGCALLPPVGITPQKYVLNGIPADLRQEPVHPATLLVLAPETAPVYDTTLMAYTTQAHQIAYFSRNEWAATPAQIIFPLLVTTLRNTHYFSEVLPAPPFHRHTYALRSEILELNQDFTTEPALLQLTLRFYLSGGSTDQVIATKEMSVREPMREKNPYAGVVAANAAMEKILRELARFVIENAD